MLEKAKKEKKFEFSKIILLLETLIIWYLTYWVMHYIGISIELRFSGSFPYLTTMVTCAYTAYGTSVAFYYNKAKLENRIKLETAYGKEVVKSATQDIKSELIASPKYPSSTYSASDTYYTTYSNYEDNEDLSSDAQG